MTQHDHDLPAAPPQNGRILDARLHLLDRQLLNGDDDPVGIVDDLELAGIEEDQPIPPGTEPPIVTAILSGHVLATRIFGASRPGHDCNAFHGLRYAESAPWSTSTPPTCRSTANG